VISFSMANMKLAAGITSAALAVLVASSASGAPGRMDTTKRATQVSTDQKAVLPDAKPIDGGLASETIFDSGVYGNNESHANTEGKSETVDFYGIIIFNVKN